VKRREFISRQLNLALFTDAKLFKGHAQTSVNFVNQMRTRWFASNP
jgi:hypothetical protein